MKPHLSPLIAGTITSGQTNLLVASLPLVVGSMLRALLLRFATPTDGVPGTASMNLKVCVTQRAPASVAEALLGRVIWAATLVPRLHMTTNASPAETCQYVLDVDALLNFVPTVSERFVSLVTDNASLSLVGYGSFDVVRVDDVTPGVD